MNKTTLELLNEFAQCIDKDILVFHGDDTECSIERKHIYISKAPYILDYLIDYLLIDMGYDFTPYCSSYVFGLIHELGHIVNGWIDKDGYSLNVLALKESDYSVYNKQYKYLRLSDEIHSNEWAYEFIKKNKKILKRLERELRASDGKF